ncbi:MAG: hypothetical protein DRJ03_02415 [Chloroflexi bacterium]|nr:MAG: hypothetical protein DRJ03_02415 [Chloroflexota bacterium]
MNKGLALLTGLLLAAGCAKVTPPTPEMIQAQAHTDMVKQTCYETFLEKSVADAQVLAGIPDESKVMVILLKQQGDFSKSMMSLATGNSLDPCSGGSNLYDVQIAELKAQAVIAAKYIDGSLGLAKWVVGGVTMAHVLDDLGGVAYNLSGGSKMNVNSQNTGSYNEHVGGNIESGGTTVTDNSENCDGCETPSFGSVASMGADEEAEIQPVETVADCMTNPPGGVSGAGKPMYNSTYSCETYFTKFGGG